jgi:hypothetical protein
MRPQKNNSNNSKVSKRPIGSSQVIPGANVFISSYPEKNAKKTINYTTIDCA